jgi:hypothetical protein
MNQKNRLVKLERAVQPKPASGRIVRHDLERDVYLVTDAEGSTHELTQAELNEELPFPFAILPTKAASAEEWSKSVEKRLKYREDM